MASLFRWPPKYQIKEKSHPVYKWLKTKEANNKQISKERGIFTTICLTKTDNRLIFTLPQRILLMK